MAAVAEAILRAGRGWGTETGVAGRRQSCEGGGSVIVAQGGVICPQHSVLRELCGVVSVLGGDGPTEVLRCALRLFGCMYTSFVIQVGAECG